MHCGFFANFPKVGNFQKVIVGLGAFVLPSKYILLSHGATGKR